MSNVSPFQALKPSLGTVPGDGRPQSVLPASLTSFVGREFEIGDVVVMVDEGGTRLLTLTGPGGVGKTRLALEVARRVKGDFADGVGFVRLGPVHDAVLVPSAVAQAFGVQDRGDRPLLDGLANALQSRHLLLVLDNFEHLLDEPPSWLGELLAKCPQLKVLVTSRTVLGIGGEHRYQVPQLPPPKAGVAIDAAENVAALLFVQRAQAVRSGFRLSAENEETVGCSSPRVRESPGSTG